MWQSLDFELLGAALDDHVIGGGQGLDRAKWYWFRSMMRGKVLGPLSLGGSGVLLHLFWGCQPEYLHSVNYTYCKQIYIYIYIYI